MGRLLLLALLCLSASDALAQAGKGWPCRYRGQHFDQGAIVCIHVAGVSRFARCDMEQNVASWTFTGPTCTAAMLPPVTPIPGRATFPPVFEQPLSPL